MDACHDTFQELNESYCFFRKEETDPDEEKKSYEKEDSYSNQVTTIMFHKNRIREIYKSNRYLIQRKEKTAEDSAKDLQITILADTIDGVKKQLDGKKKAASTIIDSEDVDIRKPAKLLKVDNTKLLSNLVKILKLSLNLQLTIPRLLMK